MAAETVQTESSTKEYLNQDEAAELIGVSSETLCVWRCQKRYGLKYYKIGRLIRYKRSDVLAWMESRAVSAN